MLEFLALETSLVVQWLRMPFNSGDVGMIPDQGTKIPYAQAQLSPFTQLASWCCN